jgi:hypothetical protein
MDFCYIPSFHSNHDSGPTRGLSKESLLQNVFTRNASCYSLILLKCVLFYMQIDSLCASSLVHRPLVT